MESKHIDAIGRRVTDLFHSKGYSDVNVEFKTGAAKGDGFIGMLLNATISAVKDGVPSQLDTVIKCAPFDENFRKNMPVRNLFFREIEYYTKLVPIYDNLQDQFELCVPQDMKCLLPKCYASCDVAKQEILVLEDLTRQGFSVISLKTLDYDHAAIILRTVAKLHALSFIYEERYPQRFSEIADQFIDALHKPCEEIDLKIMRLHGEQATKQFLDVITDTSLRERCEIAIGSNATDKFFEMQIAGKIKALLHGDNWHSNYLFKYKNGKPSEIIPIDFQWAHYGSIGYDFMYLFAFSIPGELRSQQTFYQLVDEYYSEFSSFLTLCGYEPYKFCSYEQFKDELKSLACVSMSAFILGMPMFHNPGWKFSDCLALPEVGYAVNEEYIASGNNMVTDWANLGFI